ncbi:MAG TPA: altronate dehydratase [Armatimonadetes bacterium]|nr:altronate dehydratase [Armatimonadota bacterium]
MVYSLPEKVFLLHPDDDVAVAQETLPAGTRLREGQRVWELATEVPRGHKIALRPLPAGAPVHKYGQVIGFATRPIASGEHVHTHNLGLGELTAAGEFGTAVRPVEYVPEGERCTFEGFLRPDGRAGTRNYVLVLATTNCSAFVARAIAEQFREAPRDYPQVDGVAALTHAGGCGSQLGGEGYHQLQRTLAGYAHHPNVAGCLLVGLGCEVNQAAALLAGTQLGALPPSQQPALVTVQECGGTQKAIAAGRRVVQRLLARANECRRQRLPASYLVLATECGGSDAYSGITANPAVGAAADELVRQGGTVILAETPEMYGAAHLLTSRAVSREVGEALLERLRWWEEYAAREGATLDNNPTPGNRAGGLTTIYEKALGAIAKGGTTPLRAVYRYGERISETGLVVMDTPGYDPPSVTGMVAGGANLIVFTTGRGSVYGCKPVPSLKVASTTQLYEHLSADMDVNAGVILEGATVAEVGEQIFAELLQVASGKRTKSELLGIGEEEFCPWLLGPTL